THRQPPDEQAGVAQVGDQRPAVRFAIAADVPRRDERAVLSRNLRLEFLAAGRTAAGLPPHLRAAPRAKREPPVFFLLSRVGPRDVPPRGVRRQAGFRSRAGGGVRGEEGVGAAETADAPAEQALGHLDLAATGWTADEFWHTPSRSP